MKRARWVAQSLNPRSASLRYRCIYPMNELARRGQDVGLWQAGDVPDAGLTLVFDAWTLFPTVGSADMADDILTLARQARAVGARIVFDNCDNQFAARPGAPGWDEGLRRLKLLAAMADVLVCCSDALAAAMFRHTRSLAACRVIDDPIEEAIVFPGDSRLKSLLSPSRKLGEWRLLQHALRLRGDRRAGRTPLVWFGNHGNQFSPGGMLDLLDKRAVLENVNRSFPLSLSVISNQPHKFDEHLSGWGFPTRYLEWDRTTFHRALRLHDVSVIPSTDNEFTQCKSSNRLVLSAYQGLAVLADPVPSYRVYASFARLGDWNHDLRELLAAPRRQRHQNMLLQRPALRARNGIEVIATQWSDVLFAPLPAPHPPQSQAHDHIEEIAP